ncbi:MAG: DUF2961 domain-containing protein [bacterium]
MNRSGIDNMLALDRLPFLDGSVTAHYEGSIDKQGGNADWDWWLYQDDRGEWVLLDVDGPGCIYNFVQHRYPSSKVPVFRFYFDGELEPRFTITPAEFGKKFPFIKPLADIFVGDDIPPQGRGPIWVVRSFVPMPFRKSCRITSSVKLEGADKTKGEGGWGHAIYHRYATVEGVKTFTGQEDYSPLLRAWAAVGHDPKEVTGPEQVAGNVTVASGATVSLLDLTGAGCVTALRLHADPLSAVWLRDLWLRVTWDGHSRPDVECPLGAFFGNEIGNNRIGFLTHGQTSNGTFYCYFPMPFGKSARVELMNRGQGNGPRIAYELLLAPAAKVLAPLQYGYFKASPYYPPTAVRRGRDSIIAEVAGRGHIVACTLTGRSLNNQYVSCEGDVRLYIDGRATPQIESDGSESHACYGWGFVYPPQQNPVSGYDGSGHPLYEFSETRINLGDRYPFQTGFRFAFEAGGHNDTDMVHSGVVLYYGVEAPGMILTDEVAIGDADSERAHDYRVERQVWHGELTAKYEDDVDTVRTAPGRAFNGSSEFVATIRTDNDGVRLRRLADQQHGRQRVRVVVDGVPVSERTWYQPDQNPHRRWLEDEFEIPAEYTRGKSRIKLRLEVVSASESPAWTEFQYWVYSHLQAPTGKQGK